MKPCGGRLLARRDAGNRHAQKFKFPKTFPFYPPGKYDFRSKTKSQRQLKFQGFRHKYKAES